jgi:hypothetical protein
MRLDQERRFHRYHRVLNHASWSSWEANCVLLVLILVAGKMVTKGNRDIG